MNKFALHTTFETDNKGNLYQACSRTHLGVAAVSLQLGGTNTYIVDVGEQVE